MILNSKSNPWQSESLPKVFDIVTGSTPSTKEQKYWKDGNIIWATPTDLSKLNYNVFLSDSERKITALGLAQSNLTLLPIDSILLSTRAPVGYVAINKRELCFNQGCKGLVTKEKNKVNPSFYYYYFSFIRAYLESISGGSTFKELSKDSLKNLSIPFPDIQEQTAIANILSTVDEAIQKADEAITKTERIKQAVMQKLLTEGIGHKEFKQTKVGQIPKEWKLDTLESITLNITDGKHGDCQNEENSSYYFISAKDIYNDKINYTNARHITQKDFEDAHKRTKLEPNDILLTNSGSIGKTALVDYSELSKQTTFQKSVAIIKTDKEKINPNFLIHYLANLQSYLTSLASGTSQKNLLLKDLRALVIPIPRISEQIQIIESIQNFNQHLILNKNRKLKLVRIKQGLMDDLLTGKKRVKI